MIFDPDGYSVSNERFDNSITVGEVTGFRGTSNFTYSGRLAPNFTNRRFQDVLEASLKNANLHGDGYSLDAQLIDSGDWSDWGIVWGKESRRIEIEYSLKNNKETLLQERVVSDIEVGINPITPFYLMQRRVAKINYSENIKLLIDRINDFE